MADQPVNMRGVVRAVQKLPNGKLKVEIGSATPAGLTQLAPTGSSGGGGRTESPIYNHAIEVEDTPVNRKTYFIGAGVAYGWWPALSVMEAGGLA